MNSLSDLNVYSQTSLNYTDNRSPQVIFDRANPDNQSYSIAAGEAHSIPLGIDIIDIVHPEVENVYYRIDVSSVSGASVTWPLIPDGCSVTNPTTGVYVLSYINTKEVWDQVKQPTINVPSGYSTNFTYTPSIKYEPSKTKSWTVSITVTVKAVLVANTALSISVQGIFRRASASLLSLAALSVSYLKVRVAGAGLTSTATMLVSAIKSKITDIYMASQFTANIAARRLAGARASLASQATVFANTARTYAVKATFAWNGTSADSVRGLSTTLSNDGNWILDSDLGVYSAGNQYGNLILYENNNGTVTKRSSLSFSPSDINHDKLIIQTSSDASYTLLKILDKTSYKLNLYSRSGTSLSLSQSISYSGKEIFGIALSDDGLRAAVTYKNTTTTYYYVDIYTNSAGTLSLTKTITVGYGTSTPTAWTNSDRGSNENMIAITYASDTSNYYVNVSGINANYFVSGSNYYAIATWRSGNSYASPSLMAVPSGSELWTSIKVSQATSHLIAKRTINGFYNQYAVDVYKRTSGAHTWTFFQTIDVSSINSAYVADQIDLTDKGDTVYISVSHDPTDTTATPPSNYLNWDGSVYVYQLDSGIYTNVQRITLDGVNETPTDYFGQGMRVSGEGKYLVIGYWSQYVQGAGAIKFYRDGNQV